MLFSALRITSYCVVPTAHNYTVQGKTIERKKTKKDILDFIVCNDSYNDCSMVNYTIKTNLIGDCYGKGTVRF